jgi:hypothetical protein
MAPKSSSPGAGPSKQPPTSKPKQKTSAKDPAAKPLKPPTSAKDGATGGDAPPQTERRKVEPKPLAEIEAQYPEGSIKRIMVSVLKAQKNYAGLSADGIAAKAKELKLKTCTEDDVAKIKLALSKDPNFCKLEKGIYSLHTFHPEIEIFVRAVVSKKRKADGEAGPSKTKNKAGSSAGGGSGGGGATGFSRLLASLTVAQRKAKIASLTVSKHRAALKRALAALEAAKEAAGITTEENEEDTAEGETAAASPAAESKKQRDAGPPPLSAKSLAKFELKESEKEYKGDPEDRKAMLEHRQKIQTKARELEKAKEAFIKSHNEKYEKEKNDKRDKLAAVRKAERAVATVEAELAAAEKEAEKVGEKLKTQAALVRQSGGSVDEKQHKQATAVLRPFKPMDDNELDAFLAAQAGSSSSSQQQQRPDVFSPDWLTGDDAARLATTLYVSDVLSQFGRSLGLSKPLQFADFEKALEAASDAVPEERKKKNKKESENDDEDEIDAISQLRCSEVYKGPASPLHDVYYNMMRILTEDMRGKLSTNASINRRLALNTPGSWPEALRRDVLASKTSYYVAEHDRPEDQVIEAASALLYDGADGLTADQHLSLLHYLADEVWQTEHLRSVLQSKLLLIRWYICMLGTIILNYN